MQGIVTYHSFHESNKAPKGNRVVLHNGINRCEKITHALYVTEILVVLVIRQKHILHLLQVDIGASIGKRRVKIRVWNVFASEDWNIAVCSVHIFLYVADPIEWGKVSLAVCKVSCMRGTYLSCFSAPSTILPALRSDGHLPYVPTKLP
jgi:hypothetical protein